MKLPSHDKAILRALQEDSSISHNDLAERIGMSRSSCWRRIKELTDAGIISKNVALVNRKKIDLEILVYLEVSLTEHNDKNRVLFEKHIHSLPGILQCFSVSGDRDYILFVAAKNMESYDHFLNTHILTHPTIRSARSTFTLREIKYSTAFPV